MVRACTTARRGRLCRANPGGKMNNRDERCKGDIVVVDVKQHKSQFKNSNITITQCQKNFADCVMVKFEFLNCAFMLFYLQPRCHPYTVYKLNSFYARKQLLLFARLSHRNSVRLSVRLSHGWIRQKRSKLGSPSFHRRLPGRL